MRTSVRALLACLVATAAHAAPPPATTQMALWPHLDDPQAQRLIDLPLAVSPTMFDGPAFPKIDFADPALARQMLGTYRITTTFYDEQYRPVTTAQTPGRYGAVVRITPEHGTRVLRRFRSVFRVGRPMDVYDLGRDMVLRDPQRFGLPADGSGRGDLGLLVGQVLDRLSDTDPLVAATLFGLTQPSPAGQTWRRNVDAVSADRAWWLGLKRKLNGWDKAYSTPVVGPRPIDGPAAPQLRPGTATEAGMSDAGLAALDAFCRDWAERTHEPIALCVARHSVIVLDRGYGQIGDRPATADDKFPLASVTKPIAGIAMMMLVDQGLVSLDDPVEKYLPAFAVDRPVKSATLRHLYTHTSGLTVHAGDMMNDFDEVVGEYYPHLNVGQRYEYNGGGFSLGGKIIEAVSGEPLPEFYLRHLLEPLKMDHTDIVGSAGDAMASPADLAKIGQLLLNGGAYGSMRFLKAETVESMKPVRLTQLLGPDTKVMRGVALDGGHADSPLGPHTYGQTGSTSSALRFSTDTDVVLALCRANAGADYNTYFPKLQKLIADAIVK